MATVSSCGVATVASLQTQLRAGSREVRPPTISKVNGNRSVFSTSAGLRLVRTHPLQKNHRTGSQSSSQQQREHVVLRARLADRPTETENGAIVIPRYDAEEVGGTAVAVRNGVSSSAASASNGTAVAVQSVNGAVASNGKVNGAAIVPLAEVPSGPRTAPTPGAVELLSTQDEPWFKEARERNVKVSVAPGGRWNRFKTYSTLQRSLEIWGFVFAFVIRAWLLNQKFMYKGGITEEKKTARRRELAKWLKEGLLRLGPTFIKIGQQFSTRVDILAQEYVDQLAELQDKVPPFDSDVALAIVEKELGRPILEVFERFDRDPIAAASLGQVHRARLNGQEVVVKVQRPGLKALFDIDLKNLRVIAQNLQKIDPKSDGAKRDWVAIYDECASVLYEEIDYISEGKNADKFRENFAGLDYVKVPTILWEHSTSQVLVMEYVPGIKINRIADLDKIGVDRTKLARYSVESYLEQILRHGFFHADPHPGNIAVDNVNGGRLIFYDFGMMGSISPGIREGLVEAFYGVYEKDPDKVLDALVQMGVLVETGDRTAIRRTALFFLNSFETRLAEQQKEKEAAEAAALEEFKKPLSKEEQQAKKKKRLAAIGEDLLSIAVDQPFRFPATFTFVVRAFSVLDGIGKGLDPRFDISDIARPYAMELLRFRQVGTNFFLRELQKRWDRQARAFANLVRQPDRVEKLAEVIIKLEQGDLKLRVRALEAERGFKRVSTMQRAILTAVGAAAFLNLGTLLQISAVGAAASASFAASAILGLQTLFGLLAVKRLDTQEKLITGTA